MREEFINSREIDGQRYVCLGPADQKSISRARRHYDSVKVVEGRLYGYRRGLRRVPAGYRLRGHEGLWCRHLQSGTWKLVRTDPPYGVRKFAEIPFASKKALQKFIEENATVQVYELDPTS